MKTCLHLNKAVAYSNDLILISVNYHTHATVRGRDTGWKTLAVWQLKKRASNLACNYMYTPHIQVPFVI